MPLDRPPRMGRVSAGGAPGSLRSGWKVGAGGCGPVAHHPVSRARRQSLHCGLSPPGASEGPLRGVVRDEGRAPLSWGLSLS